jgi:hypothetical protein
MSDIAIDASINANSVLDDYDPPEVVAAEFGVKENTLAIWRVKQIGPPYAIVARKIWYPRTLRREWMASQVRKPGPAPRRGR